jgi:methanogenic corrinoid protein MtbC1
MNIKLSLIESIKQGNRFEANQLLENWAAQNGYENLLTDVLEPTLQIIGEEWMNSGSFTIAQAYVAAKVAEDVMSKLAEQENPVPSKQDKGPVIVGNIEEDFHALGRRMVATFLKTDGWVVEDLGNDVPPALFVDRAVETGARVIGVSAMMLSTARNILRLRQEIDRRGLKGRVMLAVGGAVFLVIPELVDEVGGDGTAKNALGASRLFDELWQTSLKNEGLL